MGAGKGRRGGNYGDSDRDGVDDDFDQRPGNSTQSAEYAKRYDYGSTSEYTSSGMERSDQIQVTHIRNRINEQSAQQRLDDLAAQNKVHFWPDVGKFIVPDENTWAAHAQIVKDDKSGLAFNPQKYLYFDKIIAQKAGIVALYDINHPDYDKYEGLRTNLEVLRNDIIGIYLRDGSYDPGDEVFIPQIKSIAEAIGDSLGKDRWYNRFIGYESINVDIANIEGVGAAAIYESLVATQRKPATMQALRDRLNDFFGLPKDRIWELPPIEETPYSPENLSAPPPKPVNPFPPDERTEEQAVDDPNKEIADIGSKAGEVLPKMSVDQMEAMAREESLEEARKILRNLRNMEFGDHDIEEWMDTGTPKAQAAKATAINKLIQIHSLQTMLAQQKNPDIADDMFVQDGKYAADALRLSVAEFALRNLPKDHPKVPDLEKLIFQMPEHAHVRQGQSVERLLNNISTGLERTTGRQIHERSPGDRLVSMSNRIQKTARKMRSIETLDPPARQESLDLAHDILRRLRDMEMSRRPIAEFIETSRPEEKAAVAEKIDEVVEMYRNLVSEAVHINPELMKDARIQEGAEAVQEFAHTVKLMAAKEMPNSIASAQQIGADDTQDPHEWDKLHDRTIERILTSMEGGLEEAVDTIDMQEQAAEDQAEEQDRENAVESLNSHTNNRKKRKRWTRSGAGGKRSERISQDIRADDRATGQGRFSEDSPEQSTTIRPGGVSALAARAAASKSNAANIDKSGLKAQLAEDIRNNIRSEEMGTYKTRRTEGAEAEKAPSETRRSSSSASRNSRSARRAAEANREAEANAARDARAAERATRMSERDARNAARDQRAATTPQSGGGNSSRSNPNTSLSGTSSVPKGLNPEALAALQQTLKQEGNTLLNMNRQASNIPKDGVSSSQSINDRSNAEREQQNRTNKPQGRT